MIKNFWKDVEVYCGNSHSDLVKMQLINGPLSIFYACPKYYEENRISIKEKVCNNRINLVDYEKMINHISDILFNNEKNGIHENLKGYKWTEKGIDFEIIEHKNNKFKILMLSKKSIIK